MIEFLTENWKLIAILGAILVELILLLIFKKRPEIIDHSFYIKASEWILEAEKSFDKGADKLKYVLQCAKQYLGSNYSEAAVKEIVEWILTIPQKKEK